MRAVELVVETTGVANVVAIFVASPQRCGGRLAVGAAESSHAVALVVLFLLFGRSRGPLSIAASGRELFGSSWFALADLEGV
jgi:hypothetical protein